MKKKYINIYSMFIFAIGLTFTSLLGVKANTNDSSNIKPSDNCSGRGSCWTGGEGIYVTLRDENGNVKSSVVVENSNNKFNDNSQYQAGGMDSKVEIVLDGAGSLQYDKTKDTSGNTFIETSFITSLYNSGNLHSVSEQVLGLNDFDSVYNMFSDTLFAGMSKSQAEAAAKNMTLTMDPVAEIAYRDASGNWHRVVGTTQSLNDWYEANKSALGLDYFGFAAIDDGSKYNQAGGAIQLLQNLGCSASMSATCQELFNIFGETIEGFGMLWLGSFFEEEEDEPESGGASCPLPPVINVERRNNASCGVGRFSYTNYRTSKYDYKENTACEVLCDDSYTLTMPSIPLVYAGQYFDIGGLGVTQSGECKKHDYSYYYTCIYNQIMSVLLSQLSACQSADPPRDCSSIVNQINAEEALYNQTVSTCAGLSVGGVGSPNPSNWSMGLPFGQSYPATFNKYIGMEVVANTTSGDASSYYDNGGPKFTTPTNYDGGVFEYSVSYGGVFSSTFISRMDDLTTSQSCSSGVLTRDNIVKTFCHDEAGCLDPTNTFEMIKLKVAYRSIDLNNPFPGGLGTGRTVGKNWRFENNVEKYITKNRNITGTGSDLYNEKDPLYVIELDPSDMREIREYNKTHEYDDFTLNCTAGKGTECISNSFLRDVELNLITDGTCKDINNKDEFYTCADKEVPTV